MNVTFSKTDSLARIILIDSLLLGTICVVPALAHVFALPLYKMNPMQMALLAGMLLVQPRRNAYLLAVLLPTVSFLMTGMPTGVRCLCMIAELTVLIAVFQFLRDRIPCFFAMLFAMLSGKIMFYGLLSLWVSPAVLVGTSVLFQIALGVAYAGLFVCFESKMKRI